MDTLTVNVSCNAKAACLKLKSFLMVMFIWIFDYYLSLMLGFGIFATIGYKGFDHYVN